MDTAQWAQGIGVVKPMESSSSGPMVEKKARPQKDQNLNCPRCNSTNTKFCYYNNYSLSQPRYFCKTCRRYWTEGGSLRNVPVGGGSRKNKRSAPSSSSSPSQASSKKIPDLIAQSFPTQNPRDMHEGMQDLNLAYPPSTDHLHDLNSISKLVEVPFNTTDDTNKGQHVNSSNQHLSALEIFKTGGIAATTRGLSSFMSMPVTDSNTLYSAGFPMQEFKPSLNFSLDGFEGEYASFQGVQDRARMLFPVEDLKHDPTSRDGDEQNREQGDSNGFWNGILGGGSW